MKNAAKITILGILALSCCQTANAQWGRRTQRQGGGMFSRMQARTQQRWDNRNQQISMRTGRSVEQVDARRTRRVQILGAVLGGLGDGLSGYASIMNYTSPAIQPYRSNSSVLPSNFSQQMQWRSYNLNYSRNQWHAPANGF